jgi:hypothetical protein
MFYRYLSSVSVTPITMLKQPALVFSDTRDSKAQALLQILSSHSIYLKLFNQAIIG